MIILGISGLYHDSAAALIRDGRLLAGAQEERFTRIRHDDQLPINAVKYCLAEASITINDVDAVVFYDKPFLKFERLLLSHLQSFPMGFRNFVEAMPKWMGLKLWTKSLLRQALRFDGEILFTEHHIAHAASAFLVSPFTSAALLTIDGVGEWSTSTLGRGCQNSIDLFSETRFPHSIGLLYSAFTWYLGFKVNSGEYKVMGLAPYGTPRFYDKIREMIELKSDGSFRLDMQYFAYVGGKRMTSQRFYNLMGAPPRHPESILTQRDFDIAASIQAVINEVVTTQAKHLKAVTKEANLCMAGGVALNCVSNSEVLKNSGFENIWVQPAAGDAGGAIGAAFYHWNTVLKKPRNFIMDHAQWGPQYTTSECAERLIPLKAVFRPLTKDELCSRTVALLVEGKIGGWFSGRMEFGPRALGNRSIIANPLIPDMKDRLNQAIKFREGFRPFAPAIPLEEASDWFTFPRTDAGTGEYVLPLSAEFMLVIAQVRKDRPALPGVTHADGSARVQTVSKEFTPRFHELLANFGRITGVPILINTSFNVRGEPIVCTPQEAYRCFMRTNMDFLVLEDLLLLKEDQPKWTESNWRHKLPLD